MAWVACNGSGQEIIFIRKSVRHGFMPNWCPVGFEDNKYVVLPHGSIKKLIGRDLSWNDEPVELKSK